MPIDLICEIYCEPTTVREVISQVELGGAVTSPSRRVLPIAIQCPTDDLDESAQLRVVVEQLVCHALMVARRGDERLDDGGLEIRAREELRLGVRVALGHEPGILSGLALHVREDAEGVRVELTLNCRLRFVKVPRTTVSARGRHPGRLARFVHFTPVRFYTVADRDVNNVLLRATKKVRGIGDGSIGRRINFNRADGRRRVSSRS